MTITIRSATDKDASACAVIVNDWIDAKEWLPRQHSRQAIEEMIRAGLPLREFWVAGDPVQGYLSFNTEENQIMGLYTAQPGSGIGKALIDRTKQGRVWLQLWSHAANTRAHVFYRREGFVETGRKESGVDGIPEIRMEWQRPD
ncbi:MAG: GNAT family N-acetyltransferase [Pseudomonadota bacterium]